MSEQRIIAVFDSYRGLIDASRARLAEIGMTYETLDQIAGWTDTLSTKVLTYPAAEVVPGRRPAHRNLGPKSFGELIGAIGVKVAFIHDPARLERIKHHPDFKLRKRPVRPMLAEPKPQGKHPQREAVFLRKIAASGGQQRKARLRPSRRRAIAKMAAKARWHKPKVVEVLAPTRAKRQAVRCAATEPRGVSTKP